jgi:hypothetical protein
VFYSCHKESILLPIKSVKEDVSDRQKRSGALTMRQGVPEDFCVVRIFIDSNRSTRELKSESSADPRYFHSRNSIRCRYGMDGANAGDGSNF